MASLVFLLLSSTLVLSLLFISVSADDFSTVLDKLTDTNDAIAITVLQLTFIGLLKWTGDPCYPSEWDWVSCSSNQARPRITGLYLGGLGLVGYLPDISSMDALEIIDLHKNSLTGQIPAFLGTFPKLTELNLADNDFFGSVPSSVSQNKNIKLDLTGNPKLCITETSCKNTGTKSTTTGTSTSPGTGSSTTGTGSSTTGTSTSPGTGSSTTGTGSSTTGTSTSPGTGSSTTGTGSSTTGTSTSPGTGSSTTGIPPLGNGRVKKKNNVVAIVFGTVLPIVIVFWAIVGYFAIRDHQMKNAAATNASDTAGQNEMGAAGKPEVPLQAMPTPSSNTSVPGILQGDEGQEVLHHPQMYIQDPQMHGDHRHETEIPAYKDEDYQEVPLYYPNITNDVETGNGMMKSETHHH